MGYYAQWGFDFVIPAQHVASAEKTAYSALAALQRLTESEKDKSICDLLEGMFQGLEAVESVPSPLEALASLQIRGDVTITGFAEQKWRDWEEPLLEALAPFVKAGGTIEMKGEDFDCSSIWEFNGEALIQESREPVKHTYLRELEAKAKQLKKVSALLREVVDDFYHPPVHLIHRDYPTLVKRLLEGGPALVQLAECAE